MQLRVLYLYLAVFGANSLLRSVSHGYPLMEQFGSVVCVVHISGFLFFGMCQK